MGAVCGRTAALTINGGASSSNVFNADLTFDYNQTDVTVFGSGEFGDWLSCTKNGTLTFDSYTYLGDVDTFSSFSLNTGNITLGAPCSGKDFNVDVDAKGVVVYRYAVKLVGDLS